MWARKWWLWLTPFLIILVSWAGYLRTDGYVQCEYCLAIRFRDQISWYGINVFAKDYAWSRTLRSEVCAALDRPCSHRRTQFQIWRRWWGGTYCACPCVNGTVSLHSGDWLTPERRAAIERIAADDPSFADEFVRRVLLANDQEYLDEVVARINSLADSGESSR
jgi:hypothetical protein